MGGHDTPALSYQNDEHGHGELKVEAFEENFERLVDSGARGNLLGFLDRGFNIVFKLSNNIQKLLLRAGL